MFALLLEFQYGEGKMKHFSRMNIRNVFALSFSYFVALPMLAVFAIGSIFVLRNAKADAIDKIKTFHSSLISQLELEEKSVSARLSHLMYANNGSILSLSCSADTDDATIKYEAVEKLSSAMDYSLPPTSEILSARFCFLSGRFVEYKSSLNMEISDEFKKLLSDDIVNVHTMAFNAGSYPSLYVGTTDGNLIWIAGIAPGAFLDRSRSIEYVFLYQISSVYRTLQSYDTAYALKRNSIGYTAILSKAGDILSSARMDRADLDQYLNGKRKKGYSYITTEFDSYKILTIVKNIDLFESGWYFLQVLLVIILIVFASFIVFLRILLKNVIYPVNDVSKALKSVESGNLSMHIEPSGVEEVRNAIHSFNAMCRRLKALVSDYEEKISEQANSPDRLFCSYVQGKITDGELAIFEKTQLSEMHRLILLRAMDRNWTSMLSLANDLDTDMEFSSKCIMAPYKKNSWIILYKEDAGGAPMALTERILETFRRTTQTKATIVISKAVRSISDTNNELKYLKMSEEILPIVAWDTIHELSNLEQYLEPVVENQVNYALLAKAILKGDVKKINEEKERIFVEFMNSNMDNSKKIVMSLILSFFTLIDNEAVGEIGILGFHQDYVSTVDSLEDVKSLMLFTSTFISQAEKSVRSKLNEADFSPVEKAKRFIGSNYQKVSISLSSVAEYVGLNERYLSTLFSREEGETFISYLTTLRMQKAKELLKGTAFKVYEVAQMCGYQNSEHFNKTFKKLYGVSPTEYRKMNNRQ